MKLREILLGTTFTMVVIWAYAFWIMELAEWLRSTDIWLFRCIMIVALVIALSMGVLLYFIQIK